MKSKRFFLIALAVLMVVPFLNSCKRGANDPLSLKSRNSRISAVWTLESGYYNWLYQYEEEFRWLDDDCEKVTGAQEEYRDEYTYTKAFNFSDALAHFEQAYTTTREQEYYNTTYEYVLGKEYEDALSIKRDINFNYELTVKKNGTYRIYITYNLFEDDYPQPNAPDNDPQAGLTYSGTFTYDDDWHWTDNSLGTKQGIQFDGFPFPVVDLNAEFDLDKKFVINWVEDIHFSNMDMIFEVDKLASKELTLINVSDETGFYQEVDDEYESITSDGVEIDCEGTFTIATYESIDYRLQWISDGKSVDE
jgi:hypothetical protein